MKYLTGPELQEYLRNLPYGGLHKMAKETGMIYQSLSRIKVGKTINPTWETIKKVSEYKASQENKNEWIEWNGGSRPIINGLRCDLKFRNGDVYEYENSDDWPWTHTGNGEDIVAYRKAYG